MVEYLRFRILRFSLNLCIIVVDDASVNIPNDVKPIGYCTVVRHQTHQGHMPSAFTLRQLPSYSTTLARRCRVCRRVRPLPGDAGVAIRYADRIRGGREGSGVALQFGDHHSEGPAVVGIRLHVDWTAVE